MTACSARGCTSKRNTLGITFHSFPRDEVRRAQWMKVVKRKNWTPTRLSKLCSKHFPEEMIDRTSVSCVRLRDHAVPIIVQSIPPHLLGPETEVEKPCHEGIGHHVSSSVAENNLYNQVIIKIEDPWEEGINNYVSNNVTESNEVTVQDVHYLGNTENTQNSSFQEGNNMGGARIPKIINSAKCQKPLKIDKREETFGRFVACELSALHENSELYLRTKESILNVLMEVHFKLLRCSTVTS